MDRALQPAVQEHEEEEVLILVGMLVPLVWPFTKFSLSDLAKPIQRHS